jgi:nucleotide-binding universal stress UspA family protein
MTITSETSKPIVTVGYDGSATSRTAVLWAASEAAQRDARLRIVTAWDPSPITPWSLPDLPMWREQAEHCAGLAAAAARDLASVHLDTTSVAIEGPAGKLLATESAHCDLLIVGSAGHLGVGGWLTGSVSRQLSHRSLCPLVVLGPQAHVEPVRRLVVSSNLDPDGETDSWITAWLQRRPTEVHVIGSIHLTSTVPDWLLQDVQAKIRASMRDRNGEWIRRLRRSVPDGTVITEELVEGSVGDGLQRATRRGDLIVVPPGSEHAISLAHNGCPIAVVPAVAAARTSREVLSLIGASS